MKTLNEKDLQQFIKLWNQGYNCQQISLVMPYSKTNLYYNAYRLLKEQGIIQRHYGVKKSNTREYVKEAYLQGMTDIEQLAKRFNKTKNSIYQYLVDLNRRQKSRDMRKQIENQLQENKLNQNQIAKLYGVSRQYINQIKNELSSSLT